VTIAVPDGAVAPTVEHGIMERVFGCDDSSGGFERRIQEIDNQRRYEAIVNANEQKAYNFLYVKTFGKVIDSNYMTKVVARSSMRETLTRM